MRTTYRYDKATDAMVEVRRSGPAMPHVMGDCWAANPTVSTVDGTLIDSRAALRRHNERNEVADVGNDSAFTYERQLEAQRKHRENMPTISDRDVGEAWERLESNPNLAREIERRRQATCPEGLDNIRLAQVEAGERS